MSFAPPPPGGPHDQSTEPQEATPASKPLGADTPPPASGSSYGSASYQQSDSPSYGAVSAHQSGSPAGPPPYGAVSAQQSGSLAGPPAPPPGGGYGPPPPGGGYGPPAAGPPHGGPPYGGPPYGQGGFPTSGPVKSGFFSALFDISFDKYVTLDFAKVLYVISMVGAALWWLFVILAGFAGGAMGEGNAILGVIAILLGWIPALLWIILVRVSLEYAVAAIKTAQNTSLLVKKTE